MNISNKISNKTSQQENIKVAKAQVVLGKLTQKEFDQLKTIDPSQTKKYMGWMAKQLIAKNVTDIDELRNKIEEYNAFVNSGKAKTKDVYQFTSFDDLKKEVDELNAIGSESNSELRDDYEVVMDNDRLYIAVPYVHAASKHLGKSKFQYRDCEGGGKDSAWCTTHKDATHFNYFHNKSQLTFYYIRIKDAGLLEKVKAAFPERNGAAMVVTAIVIDKNGATSDESVDGNNSKFTPAEIIKFRKIIGI